MSACLTSGAAAYSFELEKMKSPPPSSSTTTTRATSPSSTISESSNSPLAISTRKPRTPRKRPNQTYNEAAALLSTAYPNLFPSSSSSSSSKKKTHTHSNPQFYGFAKSPLLGDDHDAAASSELLLESIEEPDFLFLPTTIQARSSSSSAEYFSELKEVNSGEMKVNNQFEFSEEEEFDAESILDEEIEQGIDSIMGIVDSNSVENRNHLINRLEQMMVMTNRKGFRFPLGLGLRSALREHNDANWCRFHTVDFEQISPRIRSTAAVEDEKIEIKKSKKKKKKKVAAATTTTEAKRLDSSKKEEAKEERKSGELMLKLDYDVVLEAWSEKDSPFSSDDVVLGSEATGADVNARLAQIDLFGDNGVREASVLRYKEKRRTRLFSKKIRYQVRKVNADQRPRMKGRFVRRPDDSPPSGQR